MERIKRHTAFNILNGVTDTSNSQFSSMDIAIKANGIVWVRIIFLMYGIELNAYFIQ